MLTNVSNLFWALQSRSDISRIQSEMVEAQRQTSSGKRIEELRDAGGGSSLIVSTQQQLRAGTAKLEALKEVEGRLAVQDLALNRAAEALDGLNEGLLQAISADDGRLVGQTLEQAFSELTAALNTSWAGQSLFGGEQVDAAPVKISSTIALAGLADLADGFEESERDQTFEVDAAARVSLAPRVSEIATTAFEAIRDVKLLLQANGGNLPGAITAVQRDALLSALEKVKKGHTELVAAQANNGDLQGRVGGELDRLGKRVDAMQNVLGGQVDADLAQVAMRLSQLQTQFQATAQTFSILREMTLLNFLR
jgi:flagellin-like hook-associated protein FlgL